MDQEKEKCVEGKEELKKTYEAPKYFRHDPLKSVSYIYYYYRY